ncbi:MAG: protein kinase, partial [Planctomycetaceae bacterium]
MATTHKPIEEILADAVEIDSAAERAEFLDAACADSAELRQELERLIDVHFTYGHLMDAPANAHLLDRASVTGLPETLAPQAPLDGTLGDFQLVREIGRGGMGVVYEGRELSLNRRVAIKVLPFTAVLDQRQLERFKTEAQAAAGLHHANIVPVFHIGHDRAVHYSQNKRPTERVFRTEFAQRIAVGDAKSSVLRRECFCGMVRHFF